MQSKGPKLPALVVLPARAEISQREILSDFNISRVTLKNWRDRRGFPTASRRQGWFNFYKTADVAQWCRKAGADVQLV